MRFLLFCVMMMFTITLAFAQPKQIIFSDPLEDIDLVNGKVFLTSKGTAFYYHLNDKYLDAVLFNDTGKLIAQKKYVVPHNKAAFYTGVHSIDEIGSNIVVFIKQRSRISDAGSHLTQALHRIVINATSGDIISNEMVASFDCDERIMERILGEAEGRTEYMKVVKDPLSNRYAVVGFNNTEKKVDNRINVRFYDTTHTLLDSINYSGGVDDSYLRFIGAFFYSKDLYLCYNENNPNTDGFEVPVYISVFRDKKKDWEVNQVNIKPFEKNSKCQFAIDEYTGIVKIITEAVLETKIGQRTIHSYMSLVDPSSLTVIANKLLIAEKASEYAMRNMGTDGGTLNCAIHTLYNDKRANTMCVVSEEYNTSKASLFLAITYLDNLGKEDEGYAIRRSSSRSIYEQGGYYEYAYFSTLGGNYLLLNDNQKNFSLPESKEKNKIGRISNTHAVIYKIVDGKLTKSFLLGIPDRKSPSAFINYKTGFYNDITRSYAAVAEVNNMNGRHKRLVFIQF